jgi:hypothetical protein
VDFRLSKVLEQIKRTQTLKVYEYFVQLLPASFDFLTSPRLNKDRKLKKIDNEAVIGDFNGHQRNQAV